MKNNKENYLKVGALISTILIILIISLFVNEDEKDAYTEISEKPEFIAIELSQVTKNKNDIYLVGNDLIPGTYKVELINDKNIGSVVKYNSTTMTVDNVIAKYTFNGVGYFNISDKDVAVKLQNVKITLQQDFYLFGF